MIHSKEIKFYSLFTLVFCLVTCVSYCQKKEHISFNKNNKLSVFYDAMKGASIGEHVIHHRTPLKFRYTRKMEKGHEMGITLGIMQYQSDHLAGKRLNDSVIYFSEVKMESQDYLIHATLVYKIFQTRKLELYGVGKTGFIYREFRYTDDDELNDKVYNRYSPSLKLSVGGSYSPVSFFQINLEYNINRLKPQIGCSFLF